MNNRFKKWRDDYTWGILITIVCALLLMIIYGIFFAEPARVEKRKISMQEYFQSQIANGADRDKLEAKLLMCQSAIRSGSHKSVYSSPIGKLACPQDPNLYY